MTDLKRVCVFCGSKHGVRPAYREAARAMGEALVAAGIDLVYGGGAVGLMGVVADAVLDAGGEVIGVIPEAHEPAARSPTSASPTSGSSARCTSGKP